MPLEEYAEKRRFDQTPEPAAEAGVSPSTGPCRFCFQRHDARRLHYDLRLERDGVLKSWAVPKGPTLTPLDKKLAVLTEDHPLMYLEWEGNIPQGSYGGGSMLTWDLGTYTVGGDGDFHKQFEKGDLKIVLKGKKVKGEFALVRTEGQNWLLIKKKDEHADPEWDPDDYPWSVVSGRTQEEVAAELEAPRAGERQMPKGARPSEMPGFISPMLAGSSDPFSHPDWWFELKWDGFRALAFCQAERTRLVSRKGNSLTRQFPELRHLRASFAANSFIVDGELVVLDERGVPDFQRLLPRMHSLHSNQLASARPAVYYVFDLVYLDGYDLCRVPLEERRRLLVEILRPDDTIRLSDVVEEHGEALFKVVAQRGLEGLVAKRKTSTYQSRRSDDWLKIKTASTLDCVVCGFTAPKGGRKHFGSLVLGRFLDGRLQHVGNAGSGFNSRSLEEVHHELAPLATTDCALDPVPKLDDPVTWVRPERVCEIKFSNWSDTGIVRHPVFLRMRPDLDPSACGPRDAFAAPATTGDDKPQVREVEGRLLKFTNLNKVLFPRDGCTKGDLIDYYDQVSEFILPHLADRPLSLKRYPDGIDQDFFFQKRPKVGFPDWIRTVTLEKSGGREVEGILCNDKPTLLYLANLACIDQNPTLSRIQNLDEPDFILLDLDPAECPFERLIEGALLLKEVLDEVGLQSFPKTSGSRGIHIYIPLAPGHTFEQSRLVGQILVQIASTRRPELFTLPRAPGRRSANRVYVDYPQNRRGATTAGPYVVRPVDGAPVSTPLRWDEVVPQLDFKSFTIKTAPARFREVGDLLAPVLTLRQSLADAVPRMERLLR